MSGSISDVERAESLLSVPTEENSDDLAADEAGEVPVAISQHDETPRDSGESSGNEEDDESGSNEEAEGVTVRDRQDVSHNVTRTIVLAQHGVSLLTHPGDQH